MARILQKTIPQVNQQVFDSSGTFTVPDGVTKVLVTGRGGAGGGGGGANNIAGSSCPGGGGGEGVTSEPILVDVVPNAAIPIIIGAGGGGGNGTNISVTTSGGAGGNGTQSSFGDILFKNIGDGGSGATTTTAGTGGTGGAFNNDGGTGGNGGSTAGQVGFTGPANRWFDAGGVGGARQGVTGGGGGGGAGEGPIVDNSATGGDANFSFTVAAAPTGAVRNSDVVTITTTGAHGLLIGQRIHISGVTDASFNSSSQLTVAGGYIVTSVPSSTTFTYDQVGANATSGTGTVHPSDGWDGINGQGGGGGGAGLNTGRRGGCGGNGSPGKIVVSW